jgi:nitroreductase
MGIEAKSSQAARQSSIDVLEAIRGRRSVRDFTPTHLDRVTIETLLQAAVQAPTAVHEEPWVFAVVQDRERLTRISDTAKVLWRQQIATGGPAPRSGTRDADMTSLLKRLSDPGFSIFYNASTLIVIAGRPLGPFVAADCWLAAENLMLAAFGLGLGSCCIGFALAALNTPQIKAELRLAEETTCVAAIIVGEPAGTVARVPRKPPEVSSWL